MDKVQFVLIITAAVAYVGSMVFAYMNTAKVKALYYSSNKYVDNKYYQEASPKGVAFGIVWPIIYLWNLAGIIYIIVSLCLPEHKSPVKLYPTLISKAYLIGYILTFSTTVGWLFAFDREILELSFALLILAVACVYFTIGVSYKLVYDNSSNHERNNRVVLLPMRILIHNGLSTLATWLTIASLLNLADVIIYEDSFGQPVAIYRGIISMVDGSSVVLVLLLVIIITWFILENFVWEKYCRYTFTIYPVLILALSALIDKLRFPPIKSEGNQNLIISSVNLSLVLVAFIARIVLSIWRWKKRSQLSAATPRRLLKDSVDNK